MQRDPEAVYLQSLAEDIVTNVTPWVGTFTIVGKSSHRTIRLAVPTWGNFEEGTLVASFLSGADNENDYQGFAFVRGAGTPYLKVSVWAKYRAAGDMQAALRFLLARPAERAAFGKVYALRSGKCWKCGRTLTTPTSIEAGIGPVCAERAA